MSASDDYPTSVREWSAATCHRALDEIDRLRAKVKVYVEVCDERDALRAQVERDRPVIEAARAWAQWRNEWGAVPNWVERPLLDAACAPDEVNEGELAQPMTQAERIVRGHITFAPDEVNEEAT